MEEKEAQSRCYFEKALIISIVAVGNAGASPVFLQGDGGPLCVTWQMVLFHEPYLLIISKSDDSLIEFIYSFQCFSNF